jgi:hypothetical protein
MTDQNSPAHCSRSTSLHLELKEDAKNLKKGNATCEIDPFSTDSFQLLNQLHVH